MIGQMILISFGLQQVCRLVQRSLAGNFVLLSGEKRTQFLFLLRARVDPSVNLR